MPAITRVEMHCWQQFAAMTSKTSTDDDWLLNGLRTVFNRDIYALFGLITWILQLPQQGLHWTAGRHPKRGDDRLYLTFRDSYKGLPWQFNVFQNLRLTGLSPCISMWLSCSYANSEASTTSTYICYSQIC
jgi:hypothetical protein